MMIDMLIDTLGDMLANVIIDRVPANGFDVLGDANVDVLKAVITVVEFTQPASAEDPFFLCCTPCKFWSTKALDSVSVLQAWTPPYHV